MLRRFGIAALRPTQRAAFDAVASGRDVLVILPTGGGKSLCYQLPAACGLTPSLVISPLVALMKDQVDALRRRGLRAAQLSGAVSQEEREAAWRALEAKALDLLYLAPEALSAPRTRERLARAAPRLLAVDEAHCISEWGESFRPAYLALGAVREALGAPPTVALTATATPRTARDIIGRLALRDPLVLAGGFDRANLRLRVEPVPDDTTRLTRLLALARGAPGPAVMYASTRRGTEQLAAAITRGGISAAPFHAGLPAGERGRLQDRFQANDLAVIVATNAFGMGVDKPDVRLVAHAEPPLTLEAYYQEAGRGGRDGGMAECHLLCGPNDLARARARLAAGRVTEPLLRRLVACVAATEAHCAHAATEGDATVPLAQATNTPARDVAAALRLLCEAGVLEPGPRGGILRLVATDRRLATDPTLDPADVAALQALRSCDERLARQGAPLPHRLLAGVAPGGDVARFLARVQGRQLGVWYPVGPAWRITRPPSDAVLAQLVARHATRQARDLWRHAQLARLVETTRCRRLVLLRYFGDAGPAGPCGACDVCGCGA